MIKAITIKNFKSIENLTFEFGRVNVIIGANGSGKTNILEAIVMGSAANANKLEYEFLGNRIRITSPEFMQNAFPGSKGNEIQLQFTQENKKISYNLINSKDDYRKWIDINREYSENVFNKVVEFLANSDQKKTEKLNINDNVVSEYFTKKSYSSKEISEFIIYTPELSFLKKFEEPSQITPLGIRGEGLFNELKQIISNKRKKKQITDIKEYLHLLDWFDDFDIPTNIMSNEFKIAIKDCYISEKLNYFDQRSANEGFLYLLFYLVLFTSEKTPAFFAIDNIETGFNPKLCTELIKVLAKLAKKYNKQVIITTHNAAILDGINLNDNNQRLFIAQRDIKGKTYIERLKNKPKSNIKLSELWVKGYLGGIPENF